MARRDFLKITALAAASVAFPLPSVSETSASKVHTKKIPSSGVLLPVIGLGTWITFNVGDNPKAREARAEIMKEFFNRGGGLIDSSPMYGSSEAVIGYGLSKIGKPAGLFSATKVWTSSASEGLEQIKESTKLWGVQKFELYQVHNLVAWEEHLKTLFAMKKKGELKHVGITTSHGRRHEDLEKIMKTVPIDFVQLTYNIQEREVEKRLLPLAKDRGIAVIANRPFEGGDLISKYEKKPLPAFAQDIGCSNWPQFLLKFIISHPAITCAIPATSKIEHLRENMGALQGPLPDEKTRQQMIDAVARL